MEEDIDMEANEEIELEEAEIPEVMEKKTESEEKMVEEVEEIIIDDDSEEHNGVGGI